MSGQRQAWAVAVVAALIGLAMEGYTFGLADHAIHLPFLLRQADPSLFPGDRLADAAAHHPSLFWVLLGAPARVVPPAFLFAALHLGSLVALARVVLAIGVRLHASWRAGALAAVALTHGWFAWGGAPTWDPLVLPRTVVLPIELLALWFYLGRRPGLAFAALGAAFTVHATSATQLALALALAVVVRARVDGWRSLLAPLAFLPTAGPLLPLLSDGGVFQPARWRVVDGPWLAVLRDRLGHHLLASTWAPEEWLAGASFLALLWAGRRATMAVRTRARERLDLVVLGLAAVGLLLGGLGAALYPVPALLQLHPWEAFRFVTILAVVGSAGLAAQLHPLSALASAVRYALVLALAFGVLPVAAAAAWLAGASERQGVMTSPRPWTVAFPVVLLCGVTLARSGPLHSAEGFRRPPAVLEVSGLGPALDGGLWGLALMGIAAGLAWRWRRRGEGDRREDPAGLGVLGWPARQVSLGLLALALVRLLVWNGGGDAQRAPWHERVQFLPWGALGEGRELEDAVRGNVPVPDRVLIPPYRMDDFRAIAQRAPVVTVKEGGEALYDRAFALEWRDRLRALSGDHDPFQGLVDQNRGQRRILGALRARLEQQWTALPGDKLVALAHRYDAGWVVLERFDASPALPPTLGSLVWRNNRYQLFRVTAARAAGEDGAAPR